MTLKFSRLLEDCRYMFMQNFYQATCSGSWVIVLTAKTLAENNTVATIADEKRVTEPN